MQWDQTYFMTQGQLITLPSIKIIQIITLPLASICLWSHQSLYFQLLHQFLINLLLYQLKKNNQDIEL